MQRKTRQLRRVIRPLDRLLKSTIEDEAVDYFIAHVLGGVYLLYAYYRYTMQLLYWRDSN